MALDDYESCESENCFTNNRSASNQCAGNANSGQIQLIIAKTFVAALFPLLNNFSYIQHGVIGNIIIIIPNFPEHMCTGHKLNIFQWCMRSRVWLVLAQIEPC